MDYDLDQEQPRKWRTKRAQKIYEQAWNEAIESGRDPDLVDLMRKLLGDEYVPNRPVVSTPPRIRLVASNKVPCININARKIPRRLRMHCVVNIER